jgi:hypothetical protein
MFLLAGLFDEPAVRARYLREPPEGVNRRALRRFTAHCKLRLVEPADQGFSVRWTHDGTWSDGSNAWVAVPVSCRTQG